MKEYLTEKEAREKRLEVYTEKIQEKVLSRSSETIRQLVEERHRQKMTQQEIADITGIKPSNMARFESGGRVLLISQFVTNQICSHVTDLPSFVSLAFLYNPADFLPDYLFHLQCYI